LRAPALTVDRHSHRAFDVTASRFCTTACRPLASSDGLNTLQQK
jgi:hypothetical protein